MESRKGFRLCPALKLQKNAQQSIWGKYVVKPEKRIVGNVKGKKAGRVVPDQSSGPVEIREKKGTPEASGQASVWLDRKT